MIMQLSKLIEILKKEELKKGDISIHIFYDDSYDLIDFTENHLDLTLEDRIDFNINI